MKKSRIENPKDEIDEGDQGHKIELESSRHEGYDLGKEILWKAPEYEFYEKSNTWYLVAGLIILAISAYAVFTNNPIMAITFILIGVVGYLNLQKEPDEVDFVINHEGIRAGRDLYVYEDIKSFWIFYDPPHTKTLSLHTNASMMPYVHVPIADEDPVRIREVIIQFVPEIKQEPTVVDSLSRFLHR